MLSHTIIFVTLFIIEIAYIKIARSKNIKDIPNHRSSHKTPTIRGGGIIIIFSIIIFFIFYETENNFLFFLIPITLVAIVSFIDDLVALSSQTRIFIHIIAFTVLFYGLDVLKVDSLFSIFSLAIAYIFSLGFLNIYNFMDGINGITFLNALITYATLLFLNESYISFVDSNLLITLLIAISIFGFYNFRGKAVCFAGDIGSITIGFSIIYFVLKLFIVTENPLVVGLLFVYVIDGGWTIIQRLFEKQNIFDAHKQHLYQLLVNNLKVSHLTVSLLFFIIQLIINVFIVLIFDIDNKYFIFILVFSILSVLYILIKRLLLNKLEM